MARASKPTVQRPQFVRRGTAARRALRVESIERIRVLLADGPLSTTEARQALGLSPSSAYAFLQHMASNLREVRKSTMKDVKGRDLWELGEDLTLASSDQVLDAKFAQRRITVPARQMGMPRDHLVAALFGPALGAAA